MFILTISSDEPKDIGRILEEVRKDILNGDTNSLGMSIDTNYEFEILPIEQMKNIQHWFDFCENK